MSIRNFIQSLAAGDNVAAKEHLEGALGEKALEILEMRKQEIAQGLFDDGSNYEEEVEEELEEEVEQLDELSKKTLGSYAKKATDDVSYHSYAQGHGRTTDAKYHDQKAMKRQAGVNKAIDRLTKEDLEEEFEGTLEEAAKKLDIWANARSPRPSGVVVHHSHPDNPKKIIKTHLNNKTALKDLDANIKASKSKVHKIALKWGRHVDLDNAPHMTRLRDYSSYLKKEEVEQLDELSPATLHSYRAQASQDATKRLNKDMQLGDAGYTLRNLQSKKNTTNPNRSLNAHAGAGAALLKHHPDLHKKISKIYDTMQQRRKKEMEVFHKRREGERRANAKIQKAAEKGEF